MRISDWSSYVCSSDLKTWKSGEKCDLARPLQHALCFSARPARPTWPGPRRQEEWTDGIRKALRPARDGASAPQPAHDDARLEHRQCRHAALQGPRPRLYRKSVVYGKRVSGRVDYGGSRIC